jgi:hypothetical protein
MQARLPRQIGDTGPLFSCVMRGPANAEHEVVCSIRGIPIAGSFHSVAIFRDLTGPRSAVRTAAALSQTTAQLVRTGTTNDILVNIAPPRRRGHPGPCLWHQRGERRSPRDLGGPPRFSFYRSEEGRSGSNSGAGRITLAQLTGGVIKVGDRPGKPLVESQARSVWGAKPVGEHLAEMVTGLDWQAAVYVPLSRAVSLPHDRRGHGRAARDAS